MVRKKNRKVQESRSVRFTSTEKLVRGEVGNRARWKWTGELIRDNF